MGDDDGADDDDEEEDKDEDVNGTGAAVIDADAKGAVETDAVTNAGTAGAAAAAVPVDDEDDDDDDVVCAMPNRGDTAAATPVFPPAVTPAGADGVTGTTGCDTSLGEAAFRPLDAGATAVDPAGRRATPNSLDVAATLPAEEVEAALDDADTDTDAVDAVDGVGPA